MRRIIPTVILVAALVGGLGLSIHAAAAAADAGAPGVEQPSTADPSAAPAPAGDKANPTEGHKEVSGPTAPADVDKAEKVVTENPLDFGEKLFHAVKSGEYWYAFGLFLCLLVVLMRMAASEFSWMKTDPGGVLTVGGMALLSIIGLALVARTPPSGALFLAGFQGMLLAMGGYVGVKKLLLPAWRKLRARMAS